MLIENNNVQSRYCVYFITTQQVYSEKKNEKSKDYSKAYHNNVYYFLITIFPVGHTILF